MIGGFIALSTVNAGGNFWLAIVLGSIGAGVFGLIIERLFLSRLYQQLDNQVLLTLGLVYIIGNVALWIYGGRVQLFDSPPVLTWRISIGNYAFPFYRVFLIGVGAIAFIALWWLVERTRIGSIVRAGMDNKEMTRALGINYSLTCSAVFALGALVGGFAGSVATPLIGVFQSMALDILLYALIVVVVGGPGSVLGTLIGALIIGLVDAFGKAFFPDLAMFTMYLGLNPHAADQTIGNFRKEPKCRGHHSGSNLIDAPLYPSRFPCQIRPLFYLFLGIYGVAALITPVSSKYDYQDRYLFCICSQSKPDLGLHGPHLSWPRHVLRSRCIHLHDPHRAHGDWKFLGGGFDCRDRCRASGGDLRDHRTPGGLASTFCS